jgi:hypothetical protein
MSGVRKTDDLSEPLAMSLVALRATEAGEREPKLLDRLWDTPRPRHYARRGGHIHLLLVRDAVFSLPSCTAPPPGDG